MQAHDGRQLVTYAHDYIGSFIAVDGLFEKIELTCLIEYLKKNHPSIFLKTLVDVGANIGNHSIFFSKFFKNVVAYEAHSEIFEVLNLNVRKFPNIDAVNIGLSDQSGSLKIQTDHSNMGASRIKPEAPTLASEAVTLEKGDNLLMAVKDIGLIKIDVEGMEINVLKGLKETIETHRPIIVFEQHIPDFEVENIETASIRHLRELGYNIIITKIQQNKGSNWISRRINNICSLFFGAKTTVDMQDMKKVPSGSYPMILAIHKNMF